MKRYITYTRKKENENFYSDPNTNWNFEKQTTGSKFYETPYELEWIFLAYVEYPDSIPLSVIDELIMINSEYNFKFINEEEANKFLKQISELISVKDFVFEDNRPLDI